MKKRLPSRYVGLVLLATSAVFLVSTTSSAISEPSVRIVSPAAGSVVYPGDRLIVTVARTASSGAGQTFLGAFGNFFLPLDGAGEVQHFSVLVPENVPPGKTRVAALRADPKRGSGIAETNYLTIIVESRLEIINISANIETIPLSFVGDAFQVKIVGTSLDGKTVPLSNSAKTSFSSSNSTVAEVATDGTVRAASSGEALVTASYQNPSGNLNKVVIPVSVPTLARGDLNGDGVVDQQDLEIEMDGLNSAPAVSGDARDLNRDGNIDVLDARILTTLCTYPRCASHP